MRWAALLKGFNIGGNRMPPVELRRLVESLGHRDAKTLLASGNIVFAAEETDGAALEPALEAVFAANGLKVAVVLRNAAELRAVIAANPFADVADERPAQLVVTFHREAFPVALLDTIASAYAGPERLVAQDRELYVDFPEGQGKSKLPEAMARARFPKIATARNWNTVVKLAELLE